MEEPATEPTSPPPNPLAAGEILRPALMLWIIILLVYGVAGALSPVLYTPEAAQNAWSFYSLSFDIAPFVCFAVTLKYVWRVPEARCVFRKPPKRAAEFCFVIAVASSLLFKMWYDWLGGSAANDIYEDSLHGMQLMWVMVHYVVIAPLFEEWAYRGLMLHHFRRVMTVPLAIATQAMMFAAMHVDFSELLSHFLYGVVAGIMRVQARALWPCMLLHALWNGAWLLRFNGYL